MIDEVKLSYGHLAGDPLEVRKRREELLLASIDNRTPVELLVDRITAARITHYRPDRLPSERRDIPCLSCGTPYRPDDPLNGENIFLCGSCILERMEGARD
jgi:hypothetical protein